MLIDQLKFILPAGFCDSGQIPAIRQLSETNAAQTEVAHESVDAAASPASSDYAG